MQSGYTIYLLAVPELLLSESCESLGSRHEFAATATDLQGYRIPVDCPHRDHRRSMLLDRRCPDCTRVLDRPEREVVPTSDFERN